MKTFFLFIIGIFTFGLILGLQTSPVLSQCPASCQLLGCAPWGEPSCTCNTCCGKTECSGGTCCVYDCPPGSCGCFLGETEIDTENSKTQKLQIKDFKEGEVISSFDPETGEISEGEVTDVSDLIREGYYELETESGKKVKVTGEHPFLAVKKESSYHSRFKLQLDKLLSSIQNKLSKIF